MCTVTAPASKKQKTEGTFAKDRLSWTALCYYFKSKLKKGTEVPEIEGIIENEADFRESSRCPIITIWNCTNLSASIE